MLWLAFVHQAAWNHYNKITITFCELRNRKSGYEHLCIPKVQLSFHKPGRNPGHLDCRNCSLLHHHATHPFILIKTFYLREAFVKIIECNDAAAIAKFLLDTVKFRYKNTYISQRLVFPDAVPPVTPIKRGFFLRSNFSFEDSIFRWKVKSFRRVKADSGSSSNSTISVGIAFLSIWSLFKCDFGVTISCCFYWSIALKAFDIYLALGLSFVWISRLSFCCVFYSDLS